MRVVYIRYREPAILFLILLLLSAADLATTYIGISHGFHEGYPTSAIIYAHYGYAGLIAGKFALLGVALSMCSWYTRYRRLVRVALCCSIVPTTLAVTANSVQLIMLFSRSA